MRIAPGKFGHGTIDSEFRVRVVGLAAAVVCEQPIRSKRQATTSARAEQNSPTR